MSSLSPSSSQQLPLLPNPEPATFNTLDCETGFRVELRRFFQEVLLDLGSKEEIEVEQLAMKLLKARFQGHLTTEQMLTALEDGVSPEELLDLCLKPVQTAHVDSLKAKSLASQRPVESTRSVGFLVINGKAPARQWLDDLGLPAAHRQQLYSRLARLEQGDLRGLKQLQTEGKPIFRAVQLGLGYRIYLVRLAGDNWAVVRIGKKENQKTDIRTVKSVLATMEDLNQADTISLNRKNK